MCVCMCVTKMCHKIYHKIGLESDGGHGFVLMALGVLGWFWFLVVGLGGWAICVDMFGEVSESIKHIDIIGVM